MPLRMLTCPRLQQTSAQSFTLLRILHVLHEPLQHRFAHRLLYLCDPIQRLTLPYPRIRSASPRPMRSPVRRRRRSSSLRRLRRRLPSLIPLTTPAPCRPSRHPPSTPSSAIPPWILTIARVVVRISSRTLRRDLRSSLLFRVIVASVGRGTTRRSRLVIFATLFVERETRTEVHDAVLADFIEAAGSDGTGECAEPLEFRGDCGGDGSRRGQTDCRRLAQLFYGHFMNMTRAFIGVGLAFLSSTSPFGGT